MEALLDQVPPVGVQLKLLVPELHIWLVPVIAVGAARIVITRPGEVINVVVPQPAVPFFQVQVIVCVPTVSVAIVAAGMVAVLVFAVAASVALLVEKLVTPSIKKFQVSVLAEALVEQPVELAVIVALAADTPKHYDVVGQLGIVAFVALYLVAAKEALQKQINSNNKTIFFIKKEFLIFKKRWLSILFVFIFFNCN